MLLFQASREIKFYFQHFIQICFYFLEKNWGGGGMGPRPLPLLRHCFLGPKTTTLRFRLSYALEGYIVSDAEYSCVNRL